MVFGSLALGRFAQAQDVHAIHGQVSLGNERISVEACEQIAEDIDEVREGPVMAFDQRPNRDNNFVKFRMRPGPLWPGNSSLGQELPNRPILEAIPVRATNFAVAARMNRARNPWREFLFGAVGVEILRGEVPLRMGLEMDDGVNPFAPAVEALAHPDNGMLGTVRHIGSSWADEITEGFVLEAQRLQGAEENGRQRIVRLSKAIETLQQSMELLFVRIAENFQKSGLGMAGLHGRPFVAAGVARCGIREQLAEPGVDQHAVEGEVFVIPVIEELGLRLGFTVWITHVVAGLMVGTGLVANARSPNRAATKAVEHGGRLDVIQCGSTRVGV